VEVSDAATVVAELFRQGVWVDARANKVRLGPAPYLLDEEIEQGVTELIAVLKKGFDLGRLG
jgi:kynureninase